MPLLQTYTDLFTQTWDYLFSAIFAVPLVLAITGRPRGWRAVMGRGVVWLVTVGLLIEALMTPQSFVGQLQVLSGWQTLFDTRSAPNMVPTLWMNVGVVVFQLVVWLGGYLLAAVLFRRIHWSAVERITGCRLTGWRHWALWLLVGPFLAWPLGLVFSVVSVVTWAAPVAQSGSGLPEWTAFLAYVLPTLVALPTAAWCAHALLAPASTAAGDDVEPITDGSVRARRLLFVAAVGMLSAGLLELLLTLSDTANFAWMSLHNASIPMSDVVSLDLVVTLTLTCLPLLFIHRIDWQKPAAITGRAWPTVARVLALLSLGSWLAWPVRMVEQLSRISYTPETVPALWQLAGGALLLLAVVWLLRYQPARVEGMED